MSARARRGAEVLRKVYVDFCGNICRDENLCLSLCRLRITGNVEERPANVGQRYCKVLGRDVGTFLVAFIVYQKDIIIGIKFICLELRRDL